MQILSLDLKIAPWNPSVPIYPTLWKTVATSQMKLRFSKPWPLSISLEFRKVSGKIVTMTHSWSGLIITISYHGTNKASCENLTNNCVSLAITRTSRKLSFTVNRRTLFWRSRKNTTNNWSTVLSSWALILIDKSYLTSKTCLNRRNWFNWVMIPKAIKKIGPITHLWGFVQICRVSF